MSLHMKRAFAASYTSHSNKYSMYSADLDDRVGCTSMRMSAAHMVDVGNSPQNRTRSYRLIVTQVFIHWHSSLRFADTVECPMYRHNRDGRFVGHIRSRSHFSSTLFNSVRRQYDANFNICTVVYVSTLYEALSYLSHHIFQPNMRK